MWKRKNETDIFDIDIWNIINFLNDDIAYICKN